MNSPCTIAKQPREKTLEKPDKLPKAKDGWRHHLEISATARRDVTEFDYVCSCPSNLKLVKHALNCIPKEPRTEVGKLQEISLMYLCMVNLDEEKYFV